MVYHLLDRDILLLRTAPSEAGGRCIVEIDRLDARWFADEYVGARRVLGIAPDSRPVVAPTDATTLPSIVAQPLLRRPLLAAAFIPAAAGSSAPQTMGLMTGGGILLVLAGAVALTFRRRRRPSNDSA